MDAETLIPLPVFDAVAQTAAEFLLRGMNVAVVGPPGTGATSVASRVQRELSAAKLPYAVFDCTAEGEITQRIAEFAGPKREPGQKGIILVDHAAALPLAQLQNVVARMREIAAQNPTSLLWLGALDTRSIKSATAIELHTDTRTHLCLPELSRDDLLRLYRLIAFFGQAKATDKDDRDDLVRLYRKITSRGELQWGPWSEAMLYFVLDWCGNDLALVEELVEHFYGDWTQRIHDESVAECLRNWLAESPAVRGYRERFAALPDPCKQHLRLLCCGGKLLLHLPEIHLETSEEIRRLFLSGFLCTNLLPGYYQFRNLLARYVVEEQMGAAPAPVELLRRSANGRVNALLQDVEVALRAMLRNVFRQMPPAQVQALLRKIKTEQKLFQPELQRTLLDWAGNLQKYDVRNWLHRALLNLVAKPHVAALKEAKANLAILLKNEREKFEATSNLWSKVCAVFCETLGPGVRAEPTPEQAVGCLTFGELSAILQSLTDRVFLDKPRSNRFIDSPKKRWPDYLTKVRRLRNEAAHLRNISFQDIEDLLEILTAIRRDQLDFLIVP